MVERTMTGNGRQRTGISMLRKMFARTATPTAMRQPAVPDGVRVYAIGDIHGQAKLLDNLHQMIGDDLVAHPVPQPKVIYLGDYVDRGHDSKGVLDRLAAPTLGGVSRVLLKGNHEELMLRFLVEPVSTAGWWDLGGRETLLSYKVDLRLAMSRTSLTEAAREFAAKLPPQHLDLIDRMPCSAAVGDYFFCHAGVKPGVPLDRQSDRDLMWIRGDFLDSDRDFGKVVVHGHTPVPAVDFRHNRINVDTGAYATNRLSCLVLEGDGRRLLQTAPASS